MSSAILYLAIVAIWAVVLVPRWLRHTHTAPQQAETHLAGSAEQIAPAAAEPSAAVGRPSFRPESTRPETAPPQAAPRPRASAPASSSSADRRARVLRARRRALSTLVLLCVGAAGLVAARLAAWWVSVPPLLMLGGFLLLLHEAARIDAERAAARFRAARDEADAWDQEDARDQAATWNAADGEPDEQRATSGDPRRPEPGQQAATYQAQADPGADVIDISGRIGDQLYDQYVDAEARAIGD